MVLKVAYLGPQGTYSQIALKTYYHDVNCDEIPCDSIENIFLAVSDGTVNAGIVPIENSCEGAVNQSLDLLAYNYMLFISGEVVLKVSHNLLVKKGTALGEITNIFSHTQAIAQCRNYISKNIPHVICNEVVSTADAAVRVSQQEKGVAAIGTKLSADLYGLEVLASNINDQANNETRFLVITKEPGVCNENCKTSLLVNVLNEPGALFQSLKEFSLRGINLTKIESRPAKTKMGEYLFFIDIDGHYLNPKVQDALEAIGKVAQSIKTLGTYPVAAQNKSYKESFLPSIDYLRQEIDIIDENIIELLSRRTRLVSRIGKLKKNKDEIQDPNREKWILQRLRELAKEKGFSPDVTEDIYNTLMKHFVSLQKEEKDEDQVEK